jgi:hypothetical protein
MVGMPCAGLALECVLYLHHTPLVLEPYVMLMCALLPVVLVLSRVLIKV